MSDQWSQWTLRFDGTLDWWASFSDHMIRLAFQRLARGQFQLGTPDEDIVVLLNPVNDEPVVFVWTKFGSMHDERMRQQYPGAATEGP